MASWFVPSLPPRVPLVAWTICGIGIANDQVACLERMLFKYVYNCLNWNLVFRGGPAQLNQLTRAQKWHRRPFSSMTRLAREQCVGVWVSMIAIISRAIKLPSFCGQVPGEFTHLCSSLWELPVASVAVPCCTACICMSHSFCISKTVTKELHLLEPFIPHV